MDILIRLLVAIALFVTSSHEADAARLALPLYGEMISGSAAKIMHGISAVTNLALAFYVLCRGVK